MSPHPSVARTTTRHPEGETMTTTDPTPLNHGPGETGDDGDTS